MILATIDFWTNIKVIPWFLKDVKHTILFGKGLCSVIVHKNTDFFSQYHDILGHTLEYHVNTIILEF